MHAGQLGRAEIGQSGLTLRSEREPEALTLSRTGDYWAIQYVGRVIHLQDSKGLADLAKLLARPGEDFHVLELIEERGAQAIASFALPASLQDGLSVTARGTWERPLDARALTAYRARHLDLTAELEEAQSHNDVGRTRRVSEELSQLVEQLQQRGRVACAATERARKAVYNRLRAAVARIARHDCELGRHLDVTVKTGIVCSYRPERARHVRSF